MNPSDFPGLQTCPQSGSWDDFLKFEQTNDPNQYATDKSNLDELKAAGAEDTYVAEYGDSATTCSTYNTQAPPAGKAVVVYTIRFKQESSASSNYKTNVANFHLSDADLTNVRAAGGAVSQGASTGLGGNSVAVSIVLQGASIYTALWQNKRFEVAVIAANVPPGDAASGATKINSRIR